MTKHFFKTLILFTGMIILGLVGVFLVSHFDKKEEQPGKENSAGIAK